MAESPFGSNGGVVTASSRVVGAHECIYGSAGNLAPGQITNGADVTFWGAQWNKLNTLTGGPAPSAFKGYDGTPGTPSPGGTWTTGPGNSARPPASIPTYMAVIVSTDITKPGSAIT